ncbi:MAG: nucleoside-triphosphatase [Desulfobacterales bacterium]
MELKMNKNLLITGPPGCGKTTLVKRLIAQLRHLKPVGFYTEEIREGGIRTGFSLNGLDGRTSILAHVDVKSRYRVGKYGVDLEAFEESIGSIPFFDPNTQMIVIDEIGKMECFSAMFTRLLDDIFDANTPVIATIALKGSGSIASIKRRPDVELSGLTRENQNLLLKKLRIHLHQ